jgi:hypothetical protein
MRLNTYIGIFVVLFSLTSCTDEFESINTNTNAPVSIQPDLLLRQIIYDYGDEMAYEGFVAGNLLGQYFTMIDFNLFDRHSLTETQFGGNPWPTLYTNLRDNELLLNAAQSNPPQAVYEGPALILKAYLAAALTDIYGNVPYSEALKGVEGMVTPAYDDQEQIYLAEGGILDNLEQGIASIQQYNGATPLNGDILFDGDLSAWVRFAQSLRIKYLMRISKQVDVGATLQIIFDEGNYISNNDENATFDFTDGQPNNFRMANLRSGDFNLFILSLTAEEILKGYDDPRLEVFFRRIENNVTPAYFGLLNGPDATQTSISVGDYSLSGTIFREATGNLDANFMTSWETMFLLAEAAERGLISADAKMLYDEGVQLAFEYWQTPMPDEYLTTGASAYGFDGANKIGQIITQKWIANIINGYEGWIEYRRTGFPALKPVAASLNDGLIPVRMPYPADEAALNKENFDKATATNGNSVNTAVWWDVE